MATKSQKKFNNFRSKSELLPTFCRAAATSSYQLQLVLTRWRSGSWYNHRFYFR